MPSLLEGKAAVGHLLRRAGFGPQAVTWPAWSALEYAAAVDRVLSELDEPVPPDPDGFDPFAYGTIQDVWMRRMVTAPCGLAEKLAFFWHGHFATSNTKVVEEQLMWSQYKLLRAKGAGNFRDLVLGISKDVAMIRWLDGNANRAGSGNANENYARELQELFTLGIGNYTEHDIREIARAFTGWGSRHYEFVLSAHFHDDGEKTIHGQTGRFGGEEVVDILVALPACSRFIAGKLLRFFSHPDPTAEEIEHLAQIFRESGLDIKATLATLFRSDGFRARAHHRALVKSPIEFAVSAVRAVGTSSLAGYVHGAVGRMGQVLFQPPSVKGWPSGKGWLSSGAVVERLKAAQRIAMFDELERPQAPLADVLDVAFQDEVPAPLADALAKTSGDERAALALGSPEFQLG